MTSFVLGLVFGVTLGFFACALMSTAKRADESQIRPIPKPRPFVPAFPLKRTKAAPARPRARKAVAKKSSRYTRPRDL